MCLPLLLVCSLSLDPNNVIGQIFWFTSNRELKCLMMIPLAFIQCDDSITIECHSPALLNERQLLSHLVVFGVIWQQAKWSLPNVPLDELQSHGDRHMLLTKVNDVNYWDRLWYAEKDEFWLELTSYYEKHEWFQPPNMLPVDEDLICIWTAQFWVYVERDGTMAPYCKFIIVAVEKNDNNSLNKMKSIFIWEILQILSKYWWHQNGTVILLRVRNEF